MDISSLLHAYQRGYSLDQAFYTDPAVLEAEWNGIWYTHWLYAGNVCQIPKAGDYFLVTIDKTEIIIIRDKDGKVHAHYNTCTHRGSAICTERSGNSAKLICPYHQWVFNKDGSLQKARMMPDDFCKEEYGLRTVALEEVAGLLFICLGDALAPFQPIRDALGPYTEPFRLHDARIVARTEQVLQANWKLVAENFRECYHCGGAHPEYCGAVIGANLTEDTTALVQTKNQVWAEKGLPTFLREPSGDSTSYAIRYPLRPGVSSYTVDGKAASIPMGVHRDHDAGVVGLVNYPNFWMDAVSDYVWTMRITPISPSQTHVEFCWLVDARAKEGVDYHAAHLMEFWEVTGEQDGILCENNFKGICSRAYRPGPYAPVEDQVINFVDWCVRQLRRAEKQG